MRGLRQRIGGYAALLLRRDGHRNHGMRRYQRLGQTVLVTLGSKLAAFATTLLAVPLTVGYLGPERYGAWATLSTLLTWLTLMDLGVGSALTNALAEAYGQERRAEARSSVATVFWLLVAVAAALGGAAAICWPLLNWAEILGISSAQARAEAPVAAAMALAMALVALPLSVIPRIHGAYQEGMISQAWAALGSLLGLALLAAAAASRAGLPTLVLALGGPPLAAQALNGAWLFLAHKPWLRPWPPAVVWAVATRLAGPSLLFTLIQLETLVFYQTDNLLIARLLGADQVTPYSVTYRLFWFTLVPHTLVAQALWPAYAEALARGDLSWVRRTFWASLAGSLLLVAPTLLVLTLYGQELVRLWAGPAAVPPREMLAWMAAWVLIEALFLPIGALLNGAGRLFWQTLYSLVTVVANLALSAALIQSWGITGAIAGTVIAYLACTTVPSCLDAAAALRGRRGAQL